MGFLWVRSLWEGRAVSSGDHDHGPYDGDSDRPRLVRMYQIDHQIAQAKTLDIGLVEGDVGIFQEEPMVKRANHLLIQQNLSAKLDKQGVDLIVWPESSYRRKMLRRDTRRMVPSNRPLVDDFRKDRLASEFHRSTPIRGFDTPLLFGATSKEPSDTPRWPGDVPFTPRNSAFLLDRNGDVVDVYDKVYLLVFGEYVPFAKTFPTYAEAIYKWIPAAGFLEPGESIDVITADLWKKGPIRFGVLICYEGLLPGFVRRFIPKNPNIFINITNDDWFGKTAERYLHFLLTIPRAIEHRLAFVRSTLTGISAFVDPVSRVIKETRMTEPEIRVIRRLWNLRRSIKRLEMHFDMHGIQHPLFGGAESAGGEAKV